MKTIDIVEDPHAAVDIEAALFRTLRESLPQAENTSLTFAARDSKGRLVGGMSGSTAYGWLLVKTLWVSPQARFAGLGSRLLIAAEAADGRMAAIPRGWIRPARRRCFFTENAAMCVSATWPIRTPSFRHRTVASS